MALGTYDGKTSRSFYLVGELDIGTTACHVGGYGYSTFTARFGYNVRLLLVELGIQYVVLYLAYCKHTTEELGNLYRCGTYKYRSAFGYQFYNLFYYCVVFFTFRFIDTVFHIYTCYRFVGWDYHNIEFVDIPKFARFGLGSTRHTCEFVVHTEVVLQSDGGVCLCGSLYFYMLFGLDSLVESVAIAATIHNTTRLLVYNKYFIVHHHILVVFYE